MSTLEQGSPEWKALRMNYLGASDSASVMGVGFNTPKELFEIKMGLRFVEENQWMVRGRDLEPLARACYEEMILELMYPSVHFIDKYPFLMASLDGLSADGSSMVEIKCPGPRGHEDALAGHIPKKYMIQMQHQMIVLNHDRMHYFSFDGRSGHIIEVKKDENLMAEIIEADQEFFRRMQDFDCPPDKYRERDDEDWISVSNAYKDIDHQIKFLTEQKEEYRQKLVTLAGSSNCKGNGLMVHNSWRKGSINYKNIPQLQGIDLNQYKERPSLCWTIRQDKQ